MCDFLPHGNVCVHSFPLHFQYLVFKAVLGLSRIDLYLPHPRH